MAHRRHKGKIHWRQRVYQAAMGDWIVRPLCNVQDICKEPYEATTYKKNVTCLACLRIGKGKNRGHIVR